MEIINTNDKKQEALTLHAEIMTKASVVANALVDFSLSLKKMRDRKLYLELDCNSFEEYTENVVGIKSRQAYNYIAVVEGFGEVKMIEHANLGITKLSLLLEVPRLACDEFIEENNVAEMSTRELKAKIKGLEEKLEQISLIPEPINEEKTKELEEENSVLKHEIEDLKNRNAPEPVEIDLEAIDAEYQDKIDAMKSDFENTIAAKELEIQKLESEQKQIEPVQKTKVPTNDVMKVGLLLEQMLKTSHEVSSAISAMTDADDRVKARKAAQQYIKTNITMQW